MIDFTAILVGALTVGMLSIIYAVVITEFYR